MRHIGWLCVMLLGFNCSKQIPVKPSFISFKSTQDSIWVVGSNTLACPLFIKSELRKTGHYTITQLKSKSSDKMIGFKSSETDTTQILKRYKFAGYYGIYEFDAYDTLFNYALPFKKGCTSQIIQGYDGEFSHQGSFSAKTLDFKMAVGDTVLASRDGVVIKVVTQHNKQGTTDAFRKYGNYVMIYHDDNTFSQYVHLKQYGNLVAVGDSVRLGEPIALSGFTGLTTTPHLHFGVYILTKK